MRETSRCGLAPGITAPPSLSPRRDGRPCCRDPTFLAETGILPRKLADRVAGPATVEPGIQAFQLPNPLYNTGATATRTPPAPSQSIPNARLH